MGLGAKFFTWSFVHAPWFAQYWADKRGVSRGEAPFAALQKPLSELKIGLVTTGGVHHPEDEPFRRQEESPHGDGTWRRLDLPRLQDAYEITHDWYETGDAKQDLNLVLPYERLTELAAEGIIGSVHPVGVGIMGHVEEAEERRLELVSAPEVAGLMQAEAVDAVLLVPA
ncbi:MAG: glycine/sarcosine/betaine reductase selenoprotein B family protein [Deltaproteobacteria bacterium]|nr:glycine/sarcosine/betaine reductase selenoprotein B family protein [Deltaproteobacteria bacterium]